MRRRHSRQTKKLFARNENRGGILDIMKLILVPDRKDLSHEELGQVWASVAEKLTAYGFPFRHDPSAPDQPDRKFIADITGIPLSPLRVCQISTAVEGLPISLEALLSDGAQLVLPKGFFQRVPPDAET